MSVFLPERLQLAAASLTFKLRFSHLPFLSKPCTSCALTSEPTTEPFCHVVEAAETQLASSDPKATDFHSGAEREGHKSIILFWTFWPASVHLCAAAGRL